MSLRIGGFLLCIVPYAFSQNPVQPSTAYTLGPRDELVVQVLDVEEFTATPVRIDLEGDLKLPLIGTVTAGGLSVEQLEAAIKEKLKIFVVEPDVRVMVANYRSQPISILGSVRAPGVYQLEGRKNLFEVLSMAGGLAGEAGYTIKITRRKEWGAIPLPAATEDPTHQFSVAEVSIRSVLEARNPEENILIFPNDVISVPRGQLVYVIGAVRKSGGFVLGDNETITILQAMALADGVEPTAAPKSARILRLNPGSATRTEIPVDVKAILEARANDVPLGPEDMLFIPSSKAKNAAIRTLQAGVSIATGLALWRVR